MSVTDKLLITRGLAACLHTSSCHKPEPHTSPQKNAMPLPAEMLFT